MDWSTPMKAKSAMPQIHNKYNGWIIIVNHLNCINDVTYFTTWHYPNRKTKVGSDWFWPQYHFSHCITLPEVKVQTSPIMIAADLKWWVWFYYTLHNQSSFCVCTNIWGSKNCVLIGDSAESHSGTWYKQADSFTN